MTTLFLDTDTGVSSAKVEEGDVAGMQNESGDNGRDRRMERPTDPWEKSGANLSVFRNAQKENSKE